MQINRCSLHLGVSRLLGFGGETKFYGFDMFRAARARPHAYITILLAAGYCSARGSLEVKVVGLRIWGSGTYMSEVF